MGGFQSSKPISVSDHKLLSYQWSHSSGPPKRCVDIYVDMCGHVWTCVNTVCLWPLPGCDFCSVTLSPWSPPRSSGWALVVLVVVTHSALQLGPGKGADVEVAEIRGSVKGFQ